MNIKLNRILVKPVFLAITVALSPALTQHAAADGGGAYSGYDANQNGYLDRNEFNPFADTRQKRSASPELWNFNSIDADHDGKISEQEMVNTLMDEVKLKRRQNP